MKLFGRPNVFRTGEDGPKGEVAYGENGWFDGEEVCEGEKDVIVETGESDCVSRTGSFMLFLLLLFNVPLLWPRDGGPIFGRGLAI